MQGRDGGREIQRDEHYGKSQREEMHENKVAVNSEPEAGKAERTTDTRVERPAPESRVSTAHGLVILGASCHTVAPKALCQPIPLLGPGPLASSPCTVSPRSPDGTWESCPRLSSILAPGF